MRVTTEDRFFVGLYWDSGPKSGSAYGKADLVKMGVLY